VFEDIFPIILPFQIYIYKINGFTKYEKTVGWKICSKCFQKKSFGKKDNGFIT